MHTTVCVLTDKEEIGSDGVTGMQSMYVFHFLQLLCRAAGQDDIIAFQNSVCLSADVNGPRRTAKQWKQWKQYKRHGQRWKN